MSQQHTGPNQFRKTQRNRPIRQECPTKSWLEDCLWGRMAHETLKFTRENDRKWIETHLGVSENMVHPPKCPLQMISIGIMMIMMIHHWIPVLPPT